MAWLGHSIWKLAQCTHSRADALAPFAATMKPTKLCCTFPAGAFATFIAHSFIMRSARCDCTSAGIKRRTNYSFDVIKPLFRTRTPRASCSRPFVCMCRHCRVVCAVQSPGPPGFRWINVSPSVGVRILFALWIHRHHFEARCPRKMATNSMALCPMPNGTRAKSCRLSSVAMNRSEYGQGGAMVKSIDKMDFVHKYLLLLLLHCSRVLPSLRANSIVHDARENRGYRGGMGRQRPKQNEKLPYSQLIWFDTLDAINLRNSLSLSLACSILQYTAHHANMGCVQKLCCRTHK